MIKTSYKSQTTYKQIHNDYTPKDISAEAAICLNCTKKKCNGNCKDFYEKRRKLRDEISE